MSFADLIAKFKLNKESPFHNIAQAAIESYCLIPYPGEEDKRPTEINRYYHGGLHASSTALNLDLFIALYKKYAPEKLQAPDGSELDEKKSNY